MNQEQFNSVSSQAHSTINDFTNISHNIVDMFLDNSVNLVNNINNNLGNNNIINKNINKKISPSYNIIKSRNLENTYSLILLVYLPGCLKENISTKLVKNILHISAKTSFSTDECSIEEFEIIYETNFNLPISENIENNLKIKYFNGVLRILVEKNDLSNATNIKID